MKDTRHKHRHQHLAIIGSGASAIFLLKHLWDEVKTFKKAGLQEVSIFEKGEITGMGMPYNPRTTDRYNLSNISSEEMPELMITFGDWLRAQDPLVLEELGVTDTMISDSKVYSRLALGQYLQSQYQTILGRLGESGITVHEHANCEIVDIKEDAAEGKVVLVTSKGKSHQCSRVVIATGHFWPEEDRPEQGYYASPWPIAKLLPEEDTFHNFAIGTLGASLSAFDVIASLSHRHGKFEGKGRRMKFAAHKGAEKFKIVMHSTHGLLPHLQFDQVEPFREIYRHVDREGMLALVDKKGFLRIETYFDKICRPVLTSAFKKDEMPEMVKLLKDPDFKLRDFVEKMTDEHDYADAFKGMSQEMGEAKDSVLNHKPIHWKEVMDDLMYTLNYHAELLPAEDHLLLQARVMPFLMNVIAAMPLSSGDTILALHDAGALEMISGRVTVAGEQKKKGHTTIEIDDGGEQSTASYRMFIDCSGQKPLELEDYPFPSLIKSGRARKARAPFVKPKSAGAQVPDEKKDRLLKQNGAPQYAIGGVDIDGTCRLIGRGGKPSERIYDIAFPHTSGVRPYSYGLQACNDTSAIVVSAWVEEIRSGSSVDGEVEAVTEIYEKVSE